MWVSFFVKELESLCFLVTAGKRRGSLREACLSSSDGGPTVGNSKNNLSAVSLFFFLERPASLFFHGDRVL